MLPDSGTQGDPHEPWLDRTRQRWKVRSAYASVGVQVVALAVYFLAPRAEDRLLAFGIDGAALLLFGMLAMSVRCRACGEFVFFWAWGQRNMFGALAGLVACPQCGAKDASDDLRARLAPRSEPDRAAGPSFERVRRPRPMKGLTYVAVMMFAIWLIRRLMEVLR